MEYCLKVVQLVSFVNKTMHVVITSWVDTSSCLLMLTHRNRFALRYFYNTKCCKLVMM